jgi:hypothetical protein
VSIQGPETKFNSFLNILKSNGVGLAYFFGSQKNLGPLLLDGKPVAGDPESDLDLGVVLLEHPWDYREGEKLRRRLQEELAGCCWRKRMRMCNMPPFGASRCMPGMKSLPGNIAARF